MSVPTWQRRIRQRAQAKISELSMVTLNSKCTRLTFLNLPHRQCGAGWQAAGEHVFSSTNYYYYYVFSSTNYSPLTTMTRAWLRWSRTLQFSLRGRCGRCLLRVALSLAYNLPRVALSLPYVSCRVVLGLTSVGRSRTRVTTFFFRIEASLAF